MSKEIIAKIFGAEIWHGSVDIIATPEALKRIRDACDEALENGTGQTRLMETDGEGYKLNVVEKWI